MSKYVYFFGDGKADGDAKMRDLLGGKGASLAEMANIGLPVPAGFTITTEVCRYFYADNHECPPELKSQVEAGLKNIDEVMGAKFGDGENPLLLSCRSGARESMPGMMDTVLNIGLNETTVNALIKQSGNEHFAWDSYRRLIQMYGDVVLELKPQKKTDPDFFEDILEKELHAAGVSHEKDLPVDRVKEIVEQFKAVIKKEAGIDFPTDPMEQLWGCIGAVFGSWMNDRAIVYRRQYGIPHEWGIATNVQAMVFGNLGDDCATGVGLTRNCTDGTPGFCGDYLINAQGEDVVAGTRTPKRVEESLKDDMPEGYEQLNNIGKTLEQHYKDVQDIEFTIQKGQVWMLQTRNAKRTGLAAVRIAVDLHQEGLLTEADAVFRVKPSDLLDAAAPQLLPPPSVHPIMRGFPACPGAVTGSVAFSTHSAMRLKNDGSKVILVIRELSPTAQWTARWIDGILTACGGLSSHGALFCRGECIPGVVGAGFDFTSGGDLIIGDLLVREGAVLSIDGTTGNVFLGAVPQTVSGVWPESLDRFKRLIDSLSSDEIRIDRIGTFWLMQDVLAGRPDYTRDPPPTPRPVQRKTLRVAVENGQYVSFLQPTQAELIAVRDNMDWSIDEDTRRCIWGAISSLTRRLQQEVGIGKHFRILRPLADPALSAVEFGTRSGKHAESAGGGQLIGIEFFGINRLVKAWLPWGEARFWVAVDLSDEGRPWELDRTNPGGEGLIRGGAVIAGFSFELNGSRIATGEFKKWYYRLRTQDRSWSWYYHWKTSWREVRDALAAIDGGEAVRPELLAACQSIDLVDSFSRVLPAGRHLIQTQSASQRKLCCDQRENS